MKLKSHITKRGQMSVIWIDEPPAISGWYWHWNGDNDSAVNPISVHYSGFTTKCFVAMGQLGITKAIDCEKFGGWWSLMRIPEVPVASNI